MNLNVAFLLCEKLTDEVLGHVGSLHFPKNLIQGLFPGFPGYSRVLQEGTELRAALGRLRNLQTIPDHSRLSAHCPQCLCWAFTWACLEPIELCERAAF